MAQSESIREERHDQIYPTLDPLEIERMRRFGNLHSFAAGESLWRVGEIASGLMVVLAGKVSVTERDQFDNHKSPLGRLKQETAALVRGTVECAKSS